MLVGVKLLLAGTAALALHARLRLIPNLTDDDLSGRAWHIRGITVLAIAFAVAGALIRLGGLACARTLQWRLAWSGVIPERRLVFHAPAAAPAPWHAGWNTPAQGPSE